MLKYIWQLLVVGLPPKCVHQWSKWEVANVKSNTAGDFIVLQCRRCEICGFTQFKTNQT
jgi:hypothetical protein